MGAGYARIVLAIVSFWYMPRDHIRAAMYYIASGALDAVDGYAARWLNQSRSGYPRVPCVKEAWLEARDSGRCWTS